MWFGVQKPFDWSTSLERAVQIQLIHHLMSLLTDGATMRLFFSFLSKDNY